MELKTQIQAEAGRQDLVITRMFDLPVELVYKAYTEPEYLEQWMGTRIERLENMPHGSYRFVTTDPRGNEHGFNGVIHEVTANERITRTFEMENTPFPVQLEFLTFTPLTADTSRLQIHIIFKSVGDRDRLLQMPFAAGINMAHQRLEQIFHTTK